MKDCTTCAFFVVDEDIQNLSPEDQIIFERFQIESLSDDSKIDYETLDRLLRGIRRSTCIGGLIKPGELKENCKYFNANLSKDLTKDQLIQYFESRKGELSSRKSLVINIIFSVITAASAIWGLYQNSENKELKSDIKKFETSTVEQNSKMLKLEEQKRADSLTIISLKSQIDMNNTPAKP